MIHRQGIAESLWNKPREEPQLHFCESQADDSYGFHIPSTQEEDHMFEDAAPQGRVLQTSVRYDE